MKLMPKKMPEVGGYLLNYYNEPREYGGGDLFDWAEPVPGMFFFTIGDVMGKGLQAKFYAFSFLSYIRGTLHAMLRTSSSPAALMQRVNEILMEDEVMEETFASLLLVKWEPEKHLLTYANAGHCRPFLINAEGTKVIPHSDLILGLDKNAVFQDATIRLSPGDAIMAYTDGLIEQQVNDGKQLGEDNLGDLAHQARSCKDPIQGMLNRILEISDEKKFGDDVLVFWMQRSES